MYCYSASRLHRILSKKEIETRGTAALTAQEKNVPKAAFPVSFLWVWKTFKELSFPLTRTFLRESECKSTANFLHGKTITEVFSKITQK